METLDRDGYRIAYTTSGPPAGPPVLFSHSLGLDCESWEGVASRLGHCRIVRMDTRGHGRSDAPPGPYAIKGLALDVVALADHLGLERFHLVGLSIGGLIALWLAVHRPERLRTATLCNTAARLGDAELWNGRIAAVRREGLEAIADQVVGRYFSTAFAERHPEVVARARATLVRTSPEGYAACCAALRDEDLRREVGKIEVPALVLGATGDAATPPDKARWLSARIPASELVVLDGAGHLAPVEQPDAFCRAFNGLLDRCR